MDLGIKGRRAIVCGGSRGLGYGCANALVREGAEVLIVARTAETVASAAKALNEQGPGRASGVVADVTTDAGRATLLAACPEPDILINNAGGPPPGDFRQWGRAEWIAALDSNMLSAIELIKATIDPMIARKFGRIVNITSHMVKEPTAMLGLSNGARAGLTGFVDGLARHGVTVNNLLPGQFDTDRLRSNHEKFASRTGAKLDEFRERMRNEVPAKRFGNAEEFGATCAFLCSAHAGYITGANLLLDGGQYRGLM
jgi:3-oxoacyl-[acyl-carrier protein] reductase